MKNLLFLCLSVLCAVVITGCGSDDDDNSTGGNSNKGSITAKINGTSWSANNVQATWTSNVLGMGGAQIIGGENQQINISGMVPATGTYQLNPLSGISASYTKGSGSSVDPHVAMSGTLVVTELSSSGAKGTFSFQAGPHSVTEGSFDLKF